MDFLAFYYPGFSHCRQRDLAAGRNLDEWDLLRNPSGSVFGTPGPAMPLLGCRDSLETISIEAAMAEKYGVDAFVFDYYDDGSSIELSGPLNAFAALPTPVRFAVNICSRMPRRKLPFGLDGSGSEGNINVSVEEFREIAERLTAFFVHPRYHRSGNRCTVTMYNVFDLLNAYGLDGLRQRVSILRQVASYYGCDLNVIGLFGFLKTWDHALEFLPDLPFDSYSCYVALPDFTATEPVQHFDALRTGWCHQWERNMNDFDIQLNPCVGAGWDATPRGMPGYLPTLHGLRFPYYPIVLGATPAAFEAYLRSMVSIARSTCKVRNPLMFLGPWNEWTEGCYLLPDTLYGYGRLEAVQRAKAAL